MRFLVKLAKPKIPITASHVRVLSPTKLILMETALDVHKIYAFTAIQVTPPNAMNASKEPSSLMANVLNARKTVKNVATINVQNAKLDFSLILRLTYASHVVLGVYSVLKINAKSVS